MVEFTPTWLYVKEHNATGLKYFGKTISDPLKYKGSGKYWLNHLKKHGKDVSTIWCQRFTDKSELIEFANNFSVKNNIVESAEWANLIPENGYEDGGGIKGQPGHPHNEETKEKLRQARLKQPSPSLGLHHTEETKEKLRQANLGKVVSQETKDKTSATMTGHVFSEERNQKISVALKGRKFSEETIEKIRLSARNRDITTRRKS